MAKKEVEGAREVEIPTKIPGGGGREGGREGYITGGKAWGGVERGGEENVIEGNLVHEC